ncbi:hypothetical protein BVX99_02400 [bacterium F16]|nr:hypothetical protein BVX99_02400 [bacterium F16]
MKQNINLSATKTIPNQQEFPFIIRMLIAAFAAPLRADSRRAVRGRVVLDCYKCRGAPCVVIGDILHHAVMFGGITDRQSLEQFVKAAVDAAGLLE